MDGVGWWGTVIEMSLMDTMEAARAELGQQPTFARIHGSVCLDTPRPPPGSLARARSPTRNSIVFACLRAFRLCASLHNVRAGSAALRTSVSAALGDTAALSMGLGIQPRRAHLRRAHRHARRQSRIPCHTGATCSLAGSLLAQMPLCWQLLLAASCTNAKYAHSPPDVLWVMRPWMALSVC